MSPEAYALATLAVLLTGISKSGFAGGLGILGVPLMAIVMPPQLAAAILLPILVLIDLLSIWRFRRSFHTRTIVMLLPGAALGIALGMLGFARINDDILRVAIGVMALAFVLQFLIRAAPTTKRPAWITQIAIFGASTLSGFAGFLAHAGGPPIKGALLNQNLEKSAFVGTNAVFFFLLNTAKVFGYITLGLFSLDSLQASTFLIPALGVGVGLGFLLHRLIPQRRFTNLAYVLLALAGVNLILSGTWAFFAG